MFWTRQTERVPHRAGAGAGGWLLAVLAVVAGCGGGQPDHGDELDATGGSADGYELVIVDAESTRPQAESEVGAPIPADTASVPASEEPPTGSPVTVAADTGGVVEYDPAGQFTVQVGVFAEARQAAAEVRKLGASGYPAYALATPTGSGVRVRIGYFRSRADAERFGRRFQDDTGTAFWVDRRAGELR